MGVQRQGDRTPEEVARPGFVVNDQKSGGSSTIQYLLGSLEWGIWRRDSFFESHGHDSQECRDRMQALRLLVERGGRWVPEDQAEINTIRRGLLKLKAEYTAERNRSSVHHELRPG